MTPHHQTSRSCLRRRTARTGGAPLLVRVTMLLAAAFVSFFVLSGGASATRISWHAAQDPDPSTAADPTDAKTAPRSQRYWDEHGVVRPDYAKTDEELWAERRAAQSGDTATIRPWTVALAVGLVGGMAAGLYALHVVRTTNSSTASKLGSGPGGALLVGTGGVSADERARLARLAKFESTPTKTD